VGLGLAPSALAATSPQSGHGSVGPGSLGDDSAAAGTEEAAQAAQPQGWLKWAWNTVTGGGEEEDGSGEAGEDGVGPEDKEAGDSDTEERPHATTLAKARKDTVTVINAVVAGVSFTLYRREVASLPPRHLSRGHSSGRPRPRYSTASAASAISLGSARSLGVDPAGSAWGGTGGDGASLGMLAPRPPSRGSTVGDHGGAHEGMEVDGGVMMGRRRASIDTHGDSAEYADGDGDRNGGGAAYGDGGSGGEDGESGGEGDDSEGGGGTIQVPVANVGFVAVAAPAKSRR
jgi:hypothetical protein